MSEHRFSVGFLRVLTCSLAVLLLSACVDTLSNEGREFVRLSPCSASGSIFARTPFNKWPETYHGRVSQVIEEHLKQVGTAVNQALQCTAEELDAAQPALSGLRSIAADLPAWGRDPDRLARLSQSDIGVVLLEYLRVYECALNERRTLLAVLVPTENAAAMERGDALREEADQEQTIEDELRIARPATERTLTVISGFERLRPLGLELECVKRASLDLRNVLGLAAEASACLPRIWDTHGSLRDLE